MSISPTWIADALIESVMEAHWDRAWLTPDNQWQMAMARTHDDDAGADGVAGRLKKGWIRQAAADAYAVGDERDVARVVQHVRQRYPKYPEITVASPRDPEGAHPVCMQHGLRGDRAPFGTSKCGFRHEKYLREDELGDCFGWTFNHSKDGDTIVHGNVNKLRGPHAWIERGAKVHDEKGTYSKKEFYRQLEPTNLKKYTRDEVLINALRHRHHGPWD